MFNLAIIENNFIDIFKECKPGAYLFYISKANKYYKEILKYEEQGYLVKDAIFYSEPDTAYIVGILQKPLYKTYVDNALEYACSCLNIDLCRIKYENTANPATNPLYRAKNNYKIPEKGQESQGSVKFTSSKNEVSEKGRFPANFIIHEDLAKELDKQSGISKSSPNSVKGKYKDNENGATTFKRGSDTNYSDEGGASRFFKNTESTKDLYKYLLNLGLQPYDNKVFTNIKEIQCLI